MVTGLLAAPDPGQVAKRVLEGFTQRKLPDRSAWLISTIAHWAYGSAAGAAYDAAVFAGDYIVLPVAGLYKPIWEYDAKTVAWGLGAHLVYGTGTGTAFWLLTRTEEKMGGQSWLRDTQSLPTRQSVPRTALTMPTVTPAAAARVCCRWSCSSTSAETSTTGIPR